MKKRNFQEGKSGRTIFGTQNFWVPSPSPPSPPSNTSLPVPRPLLCLGRYPYGGRPTAVCSRTGQWVYGGSCSEIALAFTMGYNAFGQLGQADTDARDFPDPLSAPNREVITAIAMAGWHSAFLTPSQAYAMGSNEYGQLGLGPGMALAATPQPLDAPDARAIDAIATGNVHTVFVAGGRAYVMGDNRRGQLGLAAATVQQDTPRALQLPTRAPVRAVAAGSFHTVLLTEPDAASGTGPQVCGMERLRGRVWNEECERGLSLRGSFFWLGARSSPFPGPPAGPAGLPAPVVGQFQDLLHMARIGIGQETNSCLRCSELFIAFDG